ncbi:MAG: PEP-CTERM sorting domain-containing protein [Acidobacteriota bacterium]|nr:PEP-CTERM sorting domain-containing protein [Acidobacteriota bacterium]
MKFIKTAFIAVALLAATGIEAKAAAIYTVQNVQFTTDPAFTQLLGINKGGTIVGFHGAVTAQGFTLTLPSNFIAQSFPGSVQTMVTGINDGGSTVGIYMDAGGTTHGYTDIGGVFKTVDQPGTVFNQGLGINASNTTVGYFALDKAAGQMGQSAYSQQGGVFTNINALLPATNQNSQAVGINNSGNIVGFYLPTAATSIGFLDKGGVISTIDPFGSASTQALGINNNGEIVGFYVDGGGVQHGYVNLNGTVSNFDPPGSVNTTINGLNDLGQIVGFYTDSKDNVIGFVASPVPEPSTLALFGIGLLALTIKARRRKI